MNAIEIPEFDLIKVTYLKGDEEVTKVGFYMKLFNNVSIPPAFSRFKGSLLPDGWGGDKINVEDVIKWEPFNEKGVSYYRNF